MKGVEHFTFHMGGPAEVMDAGTRLVAKGYQSFWGPGRHVFGSNWFWYFNSPMGVIEYDADMDLHDEYMGRHASADDARTIPSCFFSSCGQRGCPASRRAGSKFPSSTHERSAHASSLFAFAV